MNSTKWDANYETASRQIRQLRRAYAWLRGFAGEGAQAARTAVLVRCCEVYAWGGWVNEARDLLVEIWPVVKRCPVPVVRERACTLAERLRDLGAGTPSHDPQEIIP